MNSRQAVVREWEQTAKQLDAQGERMLAADVRAFVTNMPPPRTDREWVAASILTEIVRRQERLVDRSPTASRPADRSPPSRGVDSPERSR